MTGRDLNDQEEPAVKGMKEGAPSRGNSCCTGPLVGTGGTGGKEAEGGDVTARQAPAEAELSKPGQETWVSFYYIIMKSH